MKYIPVLKNTFQADVSAMEAAIDENTILLLGSAPSYPQVYRQPTLRGSNAMRIYLLVEYFSLQMQKFENTFRFVFDVFSLYSQAILDPIEELSDLALKHHLPLHVDACFGGFMLPW